MMNMISTELMNHLAEAADERGVSVEDMVGDWFAASGWFRVIEGRVVLNRNGGVPALADRVNELLAGAVDRARVRRALLNVADLSDDRAVIGEHLAGVVAHIGAKGRAKQVVESWPRVVNQSR